MKKKMKIIPTKKLNSLVASTGGKNENEKIGVFSFVKEFYF